MREITVFWFRRDLRLFDNAGLYHALRGGRPVLPLFIFDTDILDELDDPRDARVSFIHNAVRRLHGELGGQGSTLLVRHGRPVEVWRSLLNEYSIGEVVTNRDYEPYAKQRDAAVAALVREREAAFTTYKDHLIFEGDEILKAKGDPHTVFTPYSRRWLDKLDSRLDRRYGEGEEPGSFYLQPYPSERYMKGLLPAHPQPLPTLESLGFRPTSIPLPPPEVPQGLIRNYHRTRDFPGLKGTSRLGAHFRFGTISIRRKAARARQLNKGFLNELIWRDFYAQILDHFPRVVDHAFRPEYDFIDWRDDEENFQRWCAGQTGYPIVDAGMRELNETGFMHNRVRMITASFLTKHLLIDWRRGEAYFAAKLLDYELASNNGGWQWAAGSGTDAAPYFRIFNPHTQQQKFDKDLKYVKRWVPEFGTPRYPKPIVDHKEARERCLRVYREGLERGRRG